MNLDYARTENVQFEDDEYYYYVKAVPKKMIAKEEKVVKHFGNTGSLGKKIPRHNQENISKEAIAKDLEKPAMRRRQKYSCWLAEHRPMPQ